MKFEIMQEYKQEVHILKILDSKNIVQNLYGRSFLKYIQNQKKMAKKLFKTIKFLIKKFWTIFSESSILIYEPPVCILALFQISSLTEPVIQKYGQNFELSAHFSIVKSLKVTFLKYWLTFQLYYTFNSYFRHSSNGSNGVFP